jgi:hypothetical protein
MKDTTIGTENATYGVENTPDKKSDTTLISGNGRENVQFIMYCSVYNNFTT